MSEKRQLTLDITSGAWTFVGRPIPPAPPRAISPVQPDKAYILRLPQELRIAIVEVIHRGWRRSDYEISFSELARVHRFFHNAARIFLYRSIEISMLPQSQSTLLLHRTLQENPALGCHIRNLNLAIGKFYYVSKNQDETKENLEVLDDLFVCSAAARRLDVRSEQLPNWPGMLSTVLQNALAKLPFLETIYIGGESTCLVYAPEVYKALTQAKRLQSLSVGGSYCSGRGAGVVDILPSLQRSSPITEISLYHGSEGLDVAAQLFSIPKHLRRLKIEAHSGYGYKVHLHLLFNKLAIHGSTLEAIDIGLLDDKIGPSIDLSPFTALKTLTMCWWSLQPEPLIFAESLAKGLLAPGLVELIWQFNVHEQTQPSVDALGETAIAWIHKFGRFAASRNANLKLMRIEFFPEPWEDSDYYPWDLLQPVQEDLACRGIELAFNHPFGSKQKYFDYIQDMRDSTAEYHQRVAEEEAAKARQPGGVLIDYEVWLERNPGKGEPLPEEPDFASGEFRLIEGNDIRDYFLAPAT